MTSARAHTRERRDPAASTRAEHPTAASPREGRNRARGAEAGASARPSPPTEMAKTAATMMKKPSTDPDDVDLENLSDDELDEWLRENSKYDGEFGFDPDDDSDDDENDADGKPRAKRPGLGAALPMAIGSLVLAAAAMVARWMRRRRAPAADPAPVKLKVDAAKRKKKKPPIASSSSSSAKTCAHCGGADPKPPATKLLRCGRCKAVNFCSAACQRAHWPTHRGSCVAAAPKPTAPPAATATVDVPASTAPAANAAAADARTDEQKAADTAAMRRRVAERLVADRELQGALDDLRRRIQTASDIFWRGGYREAVLQLQDIASKAHDIPHGKSVECEALRMCGHGLIRLRQFTPAKQCLSTCLEIAQSIGSASLEANARVALGQLASNIDPPDHAAAMEHHAEAKR